MATFCHNNNSPSKNDSGTVSGVEENKIDGILANRKRGRPRKTSPLVSAVEIEKKRSTIYDLINMENNHTIGDSRAIIYGKRRKVNGDRDTAISYLDEEGSLIASSLRQEQQQPTIKLKLKRCIESSNNSSVGNQSCENYGISPSSDVHIQQNKNNTTVRHSAWNYFGQVCAQPESLQADGCWDLNISNESTPQNLILDLPYSVKRSLAFYNSLPNPTKQEIDDISTANDKMKDFFVGLFSNITETVFRLLQLKEEPKSCTEEEDGTFQKDVDDDEDDDDDKRNQPRLSPMLINPNHALNHIARLWQNALWSQQLAPPFPIPPVEFDWIDADSQSSSSPSSSVISIDGYDTAPPDSFITKNDIPTRFFRTRFFKIVGRQFSQPWGTINGDELTYSEAVSLLPRHFISAKIMDAVLYVMTTYHNGLQPSHRNVYFIPIKKHKDLFITAENFLKPRNKPVVLIPKGTILVVVVLQITIEEQFVVAVADTSCKRITFFDPCQRPGTLWENHVTYSLHNYKKKQHGKVGLRKPTHFESPQDELVQKLAAFRNVIEELLEQKNEWNRQDEEANRIAGSTTSGWPWGCVCVEANKIPVQRHKYNSGILCLEYVKTVLTNNLYNDGKKSSNRKQKPWDEKRLKIFTDLDIAIGIDAAPAIN